MTEYHKIETLWRRESKKPCNMIIGEYAREEFKLLENIEWHGMEKINGICTRVMWDGNKVKLGGKTDDSQMPMLLIDKLNELFGGEVNEQLFEQTFDCGDVCLYGEGAGAKIQSGSGNYGDATFILFDVRINDIWLQRKDVEDIAKKLGIDIVPLVVKGTLKELSDFVEKGFKSQWGDFQAEGIVIKPKVELLRRDGKRIITKIKYKDYLKIAKK